MFSVGPQLHVLQGPCKSPLKAGWMWRAGTSRRFYVETIVGVETHSARLWPQSAPRVLDRCWASASGYTSAFMGQPCSGKGGGLRCCVCPLPQAEKAGAGLADADTLTSDYAPDAGSNCRAARTRRSPGRRQVPKTGQL